MYKRQILGVIQDGKGNSEQAIKTYQKALDINADSPETYYNMASVFHKLHRNEEAKKNYQKAINLKSDFVNAYFNLGLVFQNLKDYEQAMVELEILLENYIKSPWADREKH